MMKDEKDEAVYETLYGMNRASGRWLLLRCDAAECSVDCVCRDGVVQALNKLKT